MHHKDGTAFCVVSCFEQILRIKLQKLSGLRIHGAEEV